MNAKYGGFLLASQKPSQETLSLEPEAVGGAQEEKGKAIAGKLSDEEVVGMEYKTPISLAFLKSEFAAPDVWAVEKKDAGIVEGHILKMMESYGRAVTQKQDQGQDRAVEGQVGAVVCMKNSVGVMIACRSDFVAVAEAQIHALKGPGKSYEREYLAILRGFGDFRDDALSTHRFVDVGSSFGLVPGAWLGPYVCRAIKSLACANTEEIPDDYTGAFPMAVCVVSGDAEGGSGGSPVLYSDQVLYLDSHEVHQAITISLDDSSPPSYHCSDVCCMPLEAVNPSLALEFYCPNKEDFQDFCERSSELEDQSDGVPMFTIAQSFMKIEMHDGQIAATQTSYSDGDAADNDVHRDEVAVPNIFYDGITKPEVIPALKMLRNNDPLDAIGAQIKGGPKTMAGANHCYHGVQIEEKTLIVDANVVVPPGGIDKHIQAEIEAKAQIQISEKFQLPAEEDYAYSKGTDLILKGAINSQSCCSREGVVNMSSIQTYAHGRGCAEVKFGNEYATTLSCRSIHKHPSLHQICAGVCTSILIASIKKLILIDLVMCISHNITIWTATKQRTLLHVQVPDLRICRCDGRHNHRYIRKDQILRYEADSDHG